MRGFSVFAVLLLVTSQAIAAEPAQYVPNEYEREKFEAEDLAAKIVKEMGIDTSDPRKMSLLGDAFEKIALRAYGKKYGGGGTKARPRTTDLSPVDKVTRESVYAIVGDIRGLKKLDDDTPLGDRYERLAIVHAMRKTFPRSFVENATNFEGYTVGDLILYCMTRTPENILDPPVQYDRPATISEQYDFDAGIPYPQGVGFSSGPGYVPYEKRSEK